MAKTKASEVTLKVGRPEIPFKPEYCALLVKHLSEGGSLGAFGAVCNVGKETVYKWVEEHEEFSEAKKAGLAKSRQFWEQIAKMQATGQLKRIKSEKPLLDEDGQIVRDSKGEIVMHREYEAATGAQSTLIFMMKNQHPDAYRDRHDLEVTGKDGGPITFDGLSETDLEAKIQELVKKAQKTTK